MTPHPRLSEAGIDLVKRFEGLRTRAARLDDGGWTIGYGHTVSARADAEVSADQADALLIYDLDRVARAIEPLILSSLNRNQFNALVAFAFNVGVETFRQSEVLALVNAGAELQAAGAIELWRRTDFEGDSLVVDGLVRRRAAEKLLFLTPPQGFNPVPTPVVRPSLDAMPLTVVADLDVGLFGDFAYAVRLDPFVPARAPAASPEPEPEPEPAPPPFAAALEADPPAIAPDPVVLPIEPAGAFGRRPTVAIAPVPRRGAAEWLLPAIGVGGVAMFVGALLSMVFDMATPLNLAIGLVGVMFIVPPGLKLARRLFGEPPIA